MNARDAMRMGALDRFAAKVRASSRMEEVEEWIADLDQTIENLHLHRPDQLAVLVHTNVATEAGYLRWIGSRSRSEFMELLARKFAAAAAALGSAKREPEALEALAGMAEAISLEMRHRAKQQQEEEP